MKSMIQFSGLLALLVVLFTGCGDVGDAPKAETGNKVDVAEATGQTLGINTEKSQVNWVGAKVTAAHHGGFKEFDGTVSVEGGKLTNVAVTINTTSMFLAPDEPEKLHGHLLSPDFFNVEKFPTAMFEASKFEEAADTAGNTHMVTGNLTMLGKTNGVTFPAKVTVADGMVSAAAEFKINRKDWGIVYTGAADDLIKDDVAIMLNIVADAASAAPAAPAASEGSGSEG